MVISLCSGEAYLIRRWMMNAALALLFGHAPYAHAVDVKVVAQGKNAALLYVSGKIGQGDDDLIFQRAMMFDDALFVLDSPGGESIAAIKMGLYIRSRGFKTAVPDNAFCMSACALVWLAGTARFVGRNSHLGLHSVATMSAVPARNDYFNRIVSDYITQLGYSPEFAEYATKAPPQGMTWMTYADTQKYGVEVHSLSELKSFAAQAPQ
jgi:hypothetical protein